MNINFELPLWLLYSCPAYFLGAFSMIVFGILIGRGKKKEPSVFVSTTQETSGLETLEKMAKEKGE